jgi:hypothetical protein
MLSEQFIQKVAGTNDPDWRAVKPQRILPSVLGLNRDQETSLVKRIVERRGQIKELTDARKANQERWYKRWKNDFSWRPQAYGGVYQFSNVSFNESRMYTRQTLAKMQSDFFGSAPFFDVGPRNLSPGSNDSQKARVYDEFFQFELSMSNCAPVLRDALRWAAIVGERVVKAKYEVELFTRKGVHKVLADPKTNKPLMTVDGDLVFQQDEWLPATADGGGRALRKDPTFFEPAEPTWIDHDFEEQGVEYCGPKGQGLHYKDFYCPNTESSVHSADICLYEYDMPVSEIVQMFHSAELRTIKSPKAKRSFLLSKMGELRDLVLSTNKGPKAESKQAVNGEENGGDRLNPTTKVAECFVKTDPLGDGDVQEVYALILPNEERALYYNYNINIFPKGRRPLEVVRLEPAEDERWYGLGIIEANEQKQDFVDFHRNRLLWGQSLSGGIRGYRPKACQAWENAAPVWGDMKWHKLSDTADLEKDIQEKRLPPLDPESAAMVQAAVQAMTLESGQVNPNNDQLLDQRGMGTATVNKIVDRNGQDLYSMQTIEANEGLTACVKMFIGLIVQYMDKEQVVKYMEGNQEQVETLLKADVADLDFDVAFQLTRATEEDTMAKLNSVANLLGQFSKLPPAVQKSMKPLFRDAFRKLKIPDGAAALDDMEKAIEEQIAADRAAQEADAAAAANKGTAAPAPQAPASI